jgi:hypothetical protein
MDEVESLIVRTHRAGLCDRNGESVKTTGGRFIAKPRVRGYSKKWCSVCGGWNGRGETCDC